VPSAVGWHSWKLASHFCADMADSRTLEDLGEVKSLQIAVGGNALTLGFESQATIGLFFIGDAEVADDVFHRATEFTPRRGQQSQEASSKRWFQQTPRHRPSVAPRPAVDSRKLPPIAAAAANSATKKPGYGTSQRVYSAADSVEVSDAAVTWDGEAASVGPRERQCLVAAKKISPGASFSHAVSA